MWNDIETTTDYLHFSVVSDTIAELIMESGENPISIGVSGSWGSGKSSMVKMVGKSLMSRDATGKDSSYIFLEFNAWLYQGYDDAKSALLQVVAKKLEDELKRRKLVNGDDVWKCFKRFSSRINWFQVTKLAVPLLAGLIPGVSAFGPIVSLANSLKSAVKKQSSETEGTSAIESEFGSIVPEVKDLLNEENEKTVTQRIDEIRQDFEELLEKIDVTLVVLVDDLDRCLPETAISTLEAMRLLLFVKRTAFIIAADEQMIRNGVKAHFGNVDLSDGLVTSYFDKLIQVPITVPHLGVAEIKVYITLLFLELEVRRKKLDKSVLSSAISQMQKLLSNSWSKEITSDSISKCFDDNQLEVMREYITVADQLAGVLVEAENIKGNPRLIKRLLNALEIRKKIAKVNGMTLDSNMLIKMLLFERCASSAAFEYFAKEISEAEEGRPRFIEELEKKSAMGEEYVAPDSTWNDDFIKNWIKLSPKLSDFDLRPLLYLSRDRSMPIATYEELSPEAKELFEALKQIKNGVFVDEIVERLKKLGTTDLNMIFNYMAAIGRNNQWSNDSVTAMLHLTEASDSAKANFVAVLSEIPLKSIKAPMIPILCGKDWTKELMERWLNSEETSKPVKNAISQHLGGK